jgi:hypothetical protein
MDSLPFALLVSRNLDESRSALPDAPVVPDAPRRAPRAQPRAARSRVVLAHVLERAARAVAPTPSCTPAP